MHCIRCKTVIDKAVIVVETLLDNNDIRPKYYCKNCFKREFDIK